MPSVHPPGRHTGYAIGGSHAQVTWTGPTTSGVMVARGSPSSTRRGAESRAWGRLAYARGDVALTTMRGRHLHSRRASHGGEALVAGRGRPRSLDPLDRPQLRDAVLVPGWGRCRDG